MSAQEENEVTHGAECAYSGGPGEPYFQPCMWCLCGQHSLRAETWEEVGAAMDEHLRETRENGGGA